MNDDERIRAGEPGDEDEEQPEDGEDDWDEEGDEDEDDDGGLFAPPR